MLEPFDEHKPPDHLQNSSVAITLMERKYSRIEENRLQKTGDNFSIFLGELQVCTATVRSHASFTRCNRATAEDFVPYLPQTDHKKS